MSERTFKVLRAITSSPEYSSRVLTVVRQVQNAESEAQVIGLLREAVLRMGADCGAFATVVLTDGLVESAHVLLACDARLGQAYERNGWFSCDPWLVYACRHSEPQPASRIPMTPPARAIARTAAAFGFMSACVIPAPCAGTGRRAGVLYLGSETSGYFEDEEGFGLLKHVARALAMELHEWWLSRARLSLLEQARLGIEDLQLLSLELQGLRTKEIANQLGLSTHAIDSRFQRLIARLGVPNRKAAAHTVAEYGLI